MLSANRGETAMTPVRVLIAGLVVLPGVWCHLPGAALAEDTEMIVNGTPVPEGKYPWQVRIYSSMEDERGFCGGSIIASQWVLTASHCLAKGESHGGPNTAVDPADVVVGYGSIDRRKTTKIPAAKVFVHQGYLNKGLDGKADVALIKLERPIADPATITLADPESDKQFLPPGAKVTVSGWGALWSPYDKDVEALIPDLGPRQEMMDKWQFPLELREVEIDSMDNDTCNATFQPAHLSVAPSEICAMIKGTTKDSCQGDSGGPLVVAADVPRGFLQVGVVSWGTMCGNRVTPSVFARVSSFADWINETMQNN
jgi:secreted trypsin-like serine protease